MNKLLIVFFLNIIISLCTFGEPVKISMWVHEVDTQEGKFYKKIVEEFNKLNKNVRVELTSIPGKDYEDKLNIAFAEGRLPDIITV